MQLVQDIKAAFGDRAHPGENHLLLPGDDEGEGKVFIGANCWDLSAGQLALRTFVLNCFTPKAFCYFLPAYLKAGIENPDTGIPDAVLERICPPKNDPTRQSFLEWWELLSSAQKRVVLEVVRYYAELGYTVRPGAISALKRACET